MHNSCAMPVREHFDKPDVFAQVWADYTERGVQPYYRNQIVADRARLAEMNAIRQGIEPPVQDSPANRLAIAASYDADALRALLETVQCLALPQEVLQRPGMMDKVDRYARSEPPSVLGPDREQLPSMLA